MGSNPTAAIALVALLTALRSVGGQIKEAIMSKKQEQSKASACEVKRISELPIIVRDA